jgi:hypothetical protein
MILSTLLSEVVYGYRVLSGGALKSSYFQGTQEGPEVCSQASKTTPGSIAERSPLSRSHSSKSAPQVTAIKLLLILL